MKEPFYRYSDGMLVCPKCAGQYQIVLPQPIWAMCAIFEAFSKQHKECEIEEGEE